MTKRILSVAVAVMMLITSLAFTASAATDYDGVVYLQNAEKILTSLGEDTAADLWDDADREAQKTALSTAKTTFGGVSGLDWSDDAYYKRLIEERHNSTNILYYLAMLDIAEHDGDATVKNAFIEKNNNYDTTGLGLKDSFAKLDDYTTQMQSLIRTHRTVLDNHIANNLTEAEKEAYVVSATKTLLALVFNSTDIEMETSYTEFCADDKEKKLLAVIFGKELTDQLANDGISEILKPYISDNFADVRDDFAEIIGSANAETDDKLFPFMGKLISNAYNKKDANLKADMKMLFGDGEEKGALQMAFEIIGVDAGNAVNTWVNLFIREHVQTYFRIAKAKTLSASQNERIEIKEGSVDFGIEGLLAYGIDVNEKYLSLPTDLFDIKFYNEDKTENTDVDYAAGKVSITINPEKEEEYPGYAQLVRTDGTYIETYPVTIVNKKTSTIRPGVQTDSIQHTVTYETNEGTVILSEKYNKGEKVKLTKVPVKEGYIFEGWYTDPELTNHVTEITVGKDIKLYAKWVEDNGVAGSGYPTPVVLNGDEHYAYIIGYPDGTVCPENNISRAEVATIFFRLLKDDVRKENLTTENVFTDVNSDAWYNTSVSTLVKLGIITGRSEVLFAPDAPITRAEFATICARFDDSEYMVTDEFNDISGHWGEIYIHEAAARGWIKGYEDNSFRPERLITRAEAMTMINRILNRNPESTDALLNDMRVWSDCAQSDWYYLAVQEATNSHSYEKKNNVYEAWTEIAQDIDWTQYQ